MLPFNETDLLFNQLSRRTSELKFQSVEQTLCNMVIQRTMPAQTIPFETDPTT
jgi:hypothetical protein